MKSFPQPLCDADEATLLNQCRSGDKEARSRLIECNLRLVAHIVKRYQTNDKETDDYISIGTIGLIKAIDSYDYGKKIKLATYAAKCIENELLMHFRNMKKLSREVYLYEPIGCDKEGNEISLIDIIEASEPDIIGEMELKSNTARLYCCIGETLDERELEIIRARYGLYGEKEITQRELAAKLGISRSYVSRIEKKALEKLHRKMTE